MDVGAGAGAGKHAHDLGVGCGGMGAVAACSLFCAQCESHPRQTGGVRWLGSMRVCPTGSETCTCPV